MMTGDDVVQWLLALGLGGLVVEAFRSVIQKRKMNADYGQVIATSAISLLAPLEERIHALEAEVDTLEHKLVQAIERAEVAEERLRIIERAGGS